MVGIYKPAEDSQLLLQYARNNVKGSVLDMGTGSGFIALELVSEPGVNDIVAVDIDPKAIAVAKKKAKKANVINKIEFIVSDLFDKLKNRKFDWILFNPPYLPSESSLDEISWAGGNEGSEVITRFLEQAFRHLNPKGRIILVSSSFTNLKFDSIKESYDVTVLGKTRLFFETLYCLLLKPSNPFEGLGKNHQ
jgi:release factor glutamine methyltransferase